MPENPRKRLNMNFVESIKTCFAKYATFSGRASRSEFWYFCLFFVIVDICTEILDAALAGESFWSYDEFFGPITSIFYLVTQKYFIKNNVYDKIKKRSLHDVKATRSGGSTIFSTLFLLTIYLYLTSNQIFDFSLLIPLGILFTVGLYDDLYQVDFKLKFIFQLIVAKILIDQGIIINNLNGLLGIY